MKKKRFSAVLGSILALTLLAGIMIPLAQADDQTLTFLNPFGEIVPPVNQKLADRTGIAGDLDGKEVLMLWYGGTHASLDAVRALQDLIVADYPDVIFIDGAATATVTSLAAGRATPLGGARPATQDGPRDVAVYDEWAGYDAVIISVVDDNIGAFWVSYHAREIEKRGTPVAVLVNSPFEAAVNSGAVKNGFTDLRTAIIDSKWYSRAYSQPVTTTTAAPTSARHAYIRDNVLVDDDGTYGDVLDALFIAGGTPAPIAATRVLPNDKVTGTSYARANQTFYDLSIDYGFGDGLPLVIPTAVLVNELIAATDRGRDEIIGKMLGGGIITVEKVAINAAMAGVQPKSFPIVLAAMEAFAQDREKQLLYDFALRTGDAQLSVLLMISGPISAELGIKCDRSDLGSGPWGAVNDPNVAIGRAVKLCFRNIGWNSVEDTAYRGAFKRFNDHVLLVSAESLADLPAGWVSHSEFIGMGPSTTNTVTLIGVTMTRAQGATPSGGAAGGWTMSSTLSSARSAAAADGATASMPSIVTYTSYMANILSANDIGAISLTNIPTGYHEVNGGFGLKTKEAVQRALVGASTADNAANTDRNQKLVWPMVMGADSQHARTFNGGTTFNASTFQTQLVPDKGQPTAPSAPQNFSLAVTANNAQLAWLPPTRLGSTAAITYEVSKDDGRTWANVGTATNFTFVGVDGSEIFVVRAVADVRSAAEIAFVGARYDVVYSGRGAWAVNPISLVQ